MKKLTEKQKNILEFIKNFTRKNRMAPTVYEIANNFNVKTSTVFSHLKALQKKNYLVRSSKARSISLKGKSLKHEPFDGIQMIPVLDSHWNTLEKRIYYDAAAFSKPGNVIEPGDCFAVVMEDNCYTSKGIFPGDIAILQKHPAKLTPGDLVMMIKGKFPELMECRKISENMAEFFNISEKKNMIYPLNAIPSEGLIISIQRAL